MVDGYVSPFVKVEDVWIREVTRALHHVFWDEGWSRCATFILRKGKTHTEILFDKGNPHIPERVRATILWFVKAKEPKRG